MKLYALAVLVLCGCGPKPSVCTATFSGNFADFSTGGCPTREGTLLRVHADAPAVNSTLSAAIELGATASSLTSLTTTGDWSAVLTREPGCVYSAGRGAVPAGTFTLELLHSVEPLHGTLELRQFVHALPMADCGRGDLETVRFEF